MHPASHRGFSKVQNFRYIAVAQAIHEMHRDWQAVFVRKTSDKSKEVILQPIPDVGPGFSYYIERYLRPVSSCALSTNVECYTVQPSAEKLRLPQFPQISIGSQEGLLSNVFRIGMIQCSLVCERKDGILIFSYDVDESAASAIQHKTDKIAIVLFIHSFL